MEVPVEQPLPSEEEMLEYLRHEQKQGYYVDYSRSSVALGRITLLAVAAPTAAGKSTLIRRVVERDPEINLYKSSTTRERAERDGDDYVTATEGMTVAKFYEGVRKREVVNFFVHRTNNVYGTFFDGFKSPYTIGAIGTDTIEQLQGAGFRDVQTIYTLTDAETYEQRLHQGRVLQKDILPRLHEGLVSLDFARQNAGEQWMTFLELKNEELPGNTGALDEASDTISQIARHNTVSSLELDRAQHLIGDMEMVIRGAIRRLNVQ